MCSELGALGEDRGVELHCLRHVAPDFHFAVHERVLRLQFALEELDEVGVEHDEGGISLALFAEVDGTIAVLEIHGDDLGLVGLLLAHLEVVNSAHLGDDAGALGLKQGLDFLEDLDRLHTLIFSIITYLAPQTH